MTVSVDAAARFTCERTSWRISNLQLQKLLFLAHMIYLGRTNGTPLVDRDFEAWDYGPVIPALYHKLKMFGGLPIRNVFYPKDSVVAQLESETLGTTVDRFATFSPSELVAITHWERGAWANHYVPGVRGIKIPDSDILNEYRERVNGAG